MKQMNMLIQIGDTVVVNPYSINGAPVLLVAQQIMIRNIGVFIDLLQDLVSWTAVISFLHHLTRTRSAVPVYR